MVILLQLVQILGKESEHDRGSDIGRIVSAEFHELIIEGQLYFHGEATHDVLDKVLSEGDTVEVLHVVELLDDFQIGL